MERLFEEVQFQNSCSEGAGEADQYKVTCYQAAHSFWLMTEPEPDHHP